MLLAFNVGNTQTTIGVFERTELRQHWRIATHPRRTADELALIVSGLLQQVGLSFGRNVTGVVISSVVPRVTQSLRDMTERYFFFEPIVVGPGVKTGVAIVTDNPREVGADRVVNCMAAFARYGGPCVVVDFGTAITFDAVSERAEFLGGAIAPGVELSTNALVAGTAQLPAIQFLEPRSAIGRTTVENMQSGVLYGFAGLCDAIVERIRDELGASAPAIATGGLAPVIMPFTKSLDHHEPWLTLEGLRLVYERNTEREA